MNLEEAQAERDRVAELVAHPLDDSRLAHYVCLLRDLDLLIWSLLREAG